MLTASEARTEDTGGGCVITDYLLGQRVVRVDWDGAAWIAPVQWVDTDLGQRWEAIEAEFIPFTEGA